LNTEKDLFDMDIFPDDEIGIDIRAIEPNDCLFLMVDMQEKFQDIIYEMDIVIKNADILNKVAEILEIPLIVTEQNPQKLGKTLENIYISKFHKRFEKTKFSALTTDVEKYIKEKDRHVIVVYGIEAHICILQSCLDILNDEYSVLLVADAVSSRTIHNKKMALHLLNNYGTAIVTTEMLLFLLLKDAKHQSFKDISKLVK